jgi:hypothetical protein
MGNSLTSDVAAVARKNSPRVTFDASENFKGGCKHERPFMGARRAGYPPWQRVKLSSAYLRAAQAYILISMPTGTSTIFGAFQAILALLEVNPDELRPGDKIIRIKSFVSKIFRHLHLLLRRTIVHGPLRLQRSNQ